MTRFLREALRQAIAPEWRLLAILIAILLTVTNMVILSEISGGGAKTSPAFIIAALVRLFGIYFFMIALMRRAVSSPRALFMPDGAFWASVLLGIVGMALAAGLSGLLPETADEFFTVVASNLGTILLLPLAVWTVALATVRPLAFNPLPWLREFSQWLSPLIVGHLIFVLPIALLHGYIDVGLVQGTIERTVWLEIVDGVLSCLILLLSLGLMVTAYRRVANR